MKWGIAAALLSGAVLAISRDTGHFGYLALIGPVPILWWALREGKGWSLFGLAFVTGLMAEAGLMLFYGKVLPLIYAVAVFQAVLFALTLLFMVGLYRNGAPIAAVLGYAAMTAGSYYLYTLVSPNGSFGAPGYGLVEVLPLLQTASLGGVPLLSFLIALVPAGIAVSLCHPRAYGLHAVWVAPLVAALVFGLWQMAQPQGESVRVALLSDDRFVARTLADPQTNPEVAGAFAAQIAQVASKKPDYIVIPEKILLSADGFQALADQHNLSIVAGLDTPSDNGKRLNAAQLFAPHGPPQTYLKRHMVPGLELDYVPGKGPLIAGPVGVAICKDMDFPETLRGYAGVGLMLVPAWDFNLDARLHGRMAVVRGVENGFAIARTASDGLMTLSDAHGRLVAEARTTVVPRHLGAEVPMGRSGTLYTRFGDVFAGLALAIWAVIAIPLFRRRSL